MSAQNVPIFNVGSRPRIVPVVLPASEKLEHSGKVYNVKVYGVDTSGWLAWDPEGGEPDKDGNPTGDYHVIKKGYKLLREFYDEEGNPKGWADYQRYVRDWQAGKTQQSFPFTMLPKKVQEMQQGLVGAANPDPWLAQAPKPTTGKATEPPADAPATPAKASKASP
jgi:hypothetical protein